MADEKKSVKPNKDTKRPAKKKRTIWNEPNSNAAVIARNAKNG